ncbi:MAG: LamG domain-containing protein [Chthoniobacteraceae bacterium]
MYRECTWVNLTTVSSGCRIFDFGSGTTKTMYLTAQASTGKVRFGIVSTGTTEQDIDGTAAIPTAGWHHVAVTLNGATGTLYVDGTQVGQNTAMTLNPSSLGSTDAELSR